MNILFGIQGTGNGHISRARVLIKYLKQDGHNVTCLISGRDKEQLFDMEVFGDFWHRNGLTFTTKNGRVDYLQTFLNNSLVSFLSEVNQLSLDNFDLVITDFEPVTAWAAKQQNITSIGIGHQYAFGPKTPLAGDNFISRWIMKNFAPTTTSIGLHWHPYADNVLPPIIDTQLKSKPNGNHIIVYLPFENAQCVTQLLNHFSEHQFKLYAPNVEPIEVGNVSIRKTAYKAFKDDLASAKGVICNSGFELISECLHLGLPILTKPLQGQMEQHSNALALRQLGFATITENLDLASLGAWLECQRKQIPKPLPNVAKYIANWISSYQWQTDKLDFGHLWQSTLGR